MSCRGNLKTKIYAGFVPHIFFMGKIILNVVAMAKITLYNIDTIQNKFFGAGCNSPPAVIAFA